MVARTTRPDPRGDSARPLNTTKSDEWYIDRSDTALDTEARNTQTRNGAATMNTASLIDNITATIGAQFAFVTDRVYDADRPQRITCAVIGIDREGWEDFGDMVLVEVEMHDHARRIGYRVEVLSDGIGRIQPRQVLAAYDKGDNASICYKPETAN